MIKENILSKLLRSPQDILLLDTEELISLFGQEFAAMKDFSQNNPHHCYDLLTHTVKTMVEVDSFCRDVQALPLLRVAALFHDIGKPCVVRQRSDRSVFYGHAAKSAEIAAPFLMRLGYSQEQIALLVFYIIHHDDFIPFRLPEEIPDKPKPHILEINIENVTRHIKNTVARCRQSGSFVPEKADWLHLTDLCCADASAQSENVIVNGIIIDSRSRKINRLKTIRKIIEDTYF